MALLGALLSILSNIKNYEFFGPYSFIHLQIETILILVLFVGISHLISDNTNVNF